MAETGNTPDNKNKLINLGRLETFLDESKKIFEPTLPKGTDGQVLKWVGPPEGGEPQWAVSNEFGEIHAENVFADNVSSGLVESGRVKVGEQTEALQLELTADRLLIKEQLEDKTLHLTPPEVSTKFIYLDGDIPKYKIGDVGPGGGVVFYDAGKTVTSSYLDSSGSEVKYTWRYLEVSPELSITMPDGSTSSTIPWEIGRAHV